MNILLIGECYSENLGDAVICKTAYLILKERFPKSEITLFDISGRVNYNKDYQNTNVKMLNHLSSLNLFKYTNNPFKKKFYADYERFNRVICSFHNIINKSFDIAVFAGGALFMDYFAGIIYYLVKKLSNKKINIVFHACGLGALNKDSICLFRKAFSSNFVKSISIRDNYDQYDFIFGDIHKAEKTYDIALNCSKYIQINTVTSQYNYGIGIINIPEYVDVQMNIIKFFIENKLNFRIFTNGASYDEILIDKIMSKLQISKKDYYNYVLKKPDLPEELIENIISFKQIISFRMHSQIIASSYNISNSGFMWDKKVKDYYSNLNMLDFCFDPNKFDFSKLTRKMPLNILQSNVNYQAEHSKINLIKQVENSI